MTATAHMTDIATAYVNEIATAHVTEIATAHAHVTPDRDRDREPET